MAMVTCEQCKSQFKADPCAIERGRGKYCSRECYANSKRLPKIKRICEYCGNVFEESESRIKKGNGRFCSHTCAGKATNPKEQIMRSCLRCGKEFSVVVSVIKNNKGKFCSKTCSDLYHVRENHAGWKSINKTCPRCGKTFLAQQYLLERGFGKYCSKKCSSDSQKKSVDRICAWCGKSFSARPARVAIGKGKYCSKECGWIGSRTQVQLSCKICNKTFLKNPSDIKRGNGIYCSPECQSIGNSGKNHFAWREGVSFGPYCPKFNKKFKEDVRDKFNRACYHCNKTEEENGEKLSVHHIDYNHNSICNGKEWAFVPLCRKHHAKTNFDRWYWFNLWICYWAMNPEINFEAL